MTCMIFAWRESAARSLVPMGRDDSPLMSLLSRISKFIIGERVVPNHRPVIPRLIVLQDRVIEDPRSLVVHDSVLPCQKEVEHRSPRRPSRH